MNATPPDSLPARPRHFLILTLAALLSLAVHASEPPKDGMIPVAKFVLQAPPPGRYTPWHDPKDQIKWYAGEIIVITRTNFHYTTFSDVIRPMPDYSGPLTVFKDHVYLDHPGVPYPYRVAGVADGLPVLLTWEGYEQWKRTGKVFELNVLNLEKETKPKKAQPK
ncbi:MAG TPA: hypothetical protein VK815_09085 [Candidatus Acidoferrales bacterium]|jgi:hypothetical protein|nr:hypothetical protein [Candidatus Acidoferrales bacterium]